MIDNDGNSYYESLKWKLDSLEGIIRSQDQKMYNQDQKIYHMQDTILEQHLEIDDLRKQVSQSKVNFICNFKFLLILLLQINLLIFNDLFRIRGIYE